MRPAEKVFTSTTQMTKREFQKSGSLLKDSAQEDKTIKIEATARSKNLQGQNYQKENTQGKKATRLIEK